MFKGLHVDQTKDIHEPNPRTRLTFQTQLFNREPLSVSGLENGMTEQSSRKPPGTRDVPGTESSTSQMPPSKPHKSPGRGLREWQGQGGQATVPQRTRKRQKPGSSPGSLSVPTPHLTCTSQRHLRLSEAHQKAP